MKGKCVSLLLSLACGCLGWAQVEGPGVLGPFQSTTDIRGTFFAELALPFVSGITGELADWAGTPLQQVTAALFIEPHPGLNEIRGVGNVGAIWICVDGYEEARIHTFDIVTRSKPVLNTGKVNLKKKQPPPEPKPECEPCSYQFKLTNEDRENVGFMYRRCTKRGRWLTWRTGKTAPKSEGYAGGSYGQYESIPGKGKWVVVREELKDEKGKVTAAEYWFYESDGHTWQYKGMHKIAVKKETGTSCEYCSQILVFVNETWYLYNCQSKDKWGKPVGKWTTKEDEATDGKTEETEWEIPIYWKWKGSW